MKKKIIIFLSILMAVLAAFALVACNQFGNQTGDGGKEEEPSKDPAVFDFVEKRVEIRVGESKQLTVATLYEGETVTYTVNDEGVIGVDEAGLVEGTGIGTAVVKATSSLGRTALAQVTVHDPEFYPVPYITVGKDDIRLNLGDKFKLDYAFSYQGQKIDATVTVKSSDTGVVRVNGNELSAVGSGTANVVLNGTSAFGEATKTVKVTVSSTLTEFYLSLSGRDIYVGKPMDLILYAVENGKLQEVENVTYSITGEQIASIKNKTELHPVEGGDTTIVCSFQYNGKPKDLSLPIHIYGPHTCTIKFLDGTVDHELEATYGDYVPLKLKNPEGNPEYRKTIKSWSAGAQVLTGEIFVMPDEDAELTVRFVNETEENFSGVFTAGHLLNDLSTAKAEYVSDAEGESGGYVKLTCPNWSSVNFWFDEAVTVNAFSTVKMKILLAQEAALLYFGYASNDNFNKENPTKRYEAGRDRSGDVPHQTLEYGKWVTLEMPLSAFAEIGQKLNGISICVSSHSYIFIDYIAVNYGLSATDPVYQDNILYKAILAEENGSEAQAQAINTYYVWALELTDAERSSAMHQEHVAAIKGILNDHFDSKIETQYDNLPKATGDAFYTGDQKDGPEGNKHSQYASRVYEHYYMTQVKDLDGDGVCNFDAMFTFNKFAYNNYGEVSFGFFANTGGTTGIISFAGKEITIDNTRVYYYKVVIKNGMLTVYVDNQGLEPAEVLTTALDDAILNGEAELVISVDFSAWSQVESTEAYLSISAEDIK